MVPSRMFKAFTSEGGIKSPLLVKLPGRMANAGTMNHSFLHVRDIMPTILELSGVTHAEQFQDRKVRPMQGRSVLDMIAGKVESPYPGAGQVGYELFGLKAFFVDGWKVLRMPKPFGTGEWELFDLKQDPAEMIDLGKQHPRKLEEMITLWELYKTENRVLDISLDLSGLK